MNPKLAGFTVEELREELEARKENVYKIETLKNRIAQIYSLESVKDIL